MPTAKLERRACGRVKEAPSLSRISSQVALPPAQPARAARGPLETRDMSLIGSRFPSVFILHAAYTVYVYCSSVVSFQYSRHDYLPAGAVISSTQQYTKIPYTMQNRP